MGVFRRGPADQPHGTTARAGAGRSAGRGVVTGVEPPHLGGVLASTTGALLPPAAATFCGLSGALSLWGTFSAAHAFPDLQVAIGVALSAVNALVAALWFAHAARRMPFPAPWLPRLLAITAAVAALWAVGQGLRAVDIVRGVYGYGATGDLVQGAALLLGVVAVSFPSVVQAHRDGRRPDPASLAVPLDAVASGLAAVLLLWVGWLAPAGAGSDRGMLTTTVPAVGVLLVILFAQVSVWWQSGSVQQGVVTLAVLLDLVGRLTSTAASLGGTRTETAVGAVTSALLWTLLVVGLARADTAASPLVEVRVRRHSPVGSYVLVAVLALLAVYSLLSRDLTWDGTALVLVLVLLLVFAVREVALSAARLGATESLRRQAFLDPLTQLLNRHGLLDQLSRVVGDRHVVVLMLDLDGFTQINDQAGPAAADRVLVDVATALRHAVHGPGTAGHGGAGDPPGGVRGVTGPADVLVARYGADEFAVVVPGGVEVGEQVAAGITRALAEVVVPGAGAGVLGARMGVAATGPLTVQPGTPCGLRALEEAVEALAQSRRLRDEPVVTYTKALAVVRERLRVVERDLGPAVEAHEIAVFVQPLVELATGRVCAFEALARWEHPRLGPVPPPEFIGVAEQSGLIVPLGRSVLLDAVHGLCQLGERAAPVQIGVNASPIQMRSREFVDYVRSVLDTTGLAPDRLVIEVTEAVLIEDDDPAMGTLAALAGLGVHLSIDDFGTGYSALSYLRRLPTTQLKIDRSWTAALPHEPKTLAVVTHVVKLAHQLGMRVVAEGIEDAEVAGYCLDLGIDEGQGWHFGRPTPFAQAREALDRLGVVGDAPQHVDLGRPRPGPVG